MTEHRYLMVSACALTILDSSSLKAEAPTVFNPMPLSRPANAYGQAYNHSDSSKEKTKDRGDVERGA